MQLPRGAAGADVLARLDRFVIETPSWGYADTGTRFGKFLQDAAATSIDEKLADAAEVHRLTGCCPSVAVHVLWDFPGGGSEAEIRRIAARAASLGVRIGSINPNVFEDQAYKWGSLTNRDPEVRHRALDHIFDSIRIGELCGSNLLTLWFADGTNYPGQADLRQRKRWMSEGLREIHARLPADGTMLIEYKPFEPAFYHSDIADWGMAHALAKEAGPRAKVLVDLGHHLPGCNIEHIVAFLVEEGALGGFHFNDRKYADDDLTTGSIDPYQLFRIFNEIAGAEHERGGPGAGASADLPVAYMIDQSHNLKPKIEAMIQTVMTAQEIFLKAMLVDRDALRRAQDREDLVAAEGVLKDAFWTDVREKIAEHRRSRGLPPDPLAAFRESGYAARAAAQRGPRKKTEGGRYA
ncbi:MAG: L-rhamnose isomerase [Planctomycetota bacterium]|nr:MAG: L-rhamnose isomerase [Planctomycetota bacterium]